MASSLNLVSRPSRHRRDDFPTSPFFPDEIFLMPELMSRDMMSEKEQLIAQLASAVPTRPSGLIQFLKRAPNSLRWRLIIAYWLLKREATGMAHRLRGRRVLHFLHIGKTGGTAAKSALRGHENSGDYEIILHEHDFQLKDVPLGEKVVFFVRDPISRFVSGFYGRQRQDLPRHDAPGFRGKKLRSVGSGVPTN